MKLNRKWNVFESFHFPHFSLRAEREALRHDVVLFEERRAGLEALYAERKRAQEEEATKAGQREAELGERRAELERGQAALGTDRLRLAAERQQFEGKVNQVDQKRNEISLGVSGND